MLFGAGGKSKKSKTPSQYRKQLQARYKAAFPSTKGLSKSSARLVIITYLASFTLFAMLAGIFLMILVFAFFARDLPNPNQLLNRSEELSTKLMDKNGEAIYEVFGEKNRVLIKLDQVSLHLQHATLATEDSNFYFHQGIDFRGMLRALKNMVLGAGLQSGSTLTQQVVKNALLTQDQTLTRKIKEFILALQLENRYSKEEILQMYLNETPYGGQNYGVLTASKAYFDKLPAQLSIAESAYIAGLPQSPSRYSYYSSDPSLGLERKDYVLYLMNERGWLTKDGKREYLSDDAYKKALEEKLEFKQSAASFKAPHFVFYVKEELAGIFGEALVEQGGLQVKTTLDMKLQQEAEKIVKDEVEAARGLYVGNGSLVALDTKTGQVLAMVGSKDYFADSEPEGCVSGITGENSCTFEPNLNVALAFRQPGSTIKPITYATMLEQGYTAAFPFLDVPTTFVGDDTGGKIYTPENYDGIFRGPMSLRRSLGNSLNITAVKALKIAGVDAMIETAERLGITSFKDRSRFGLALTLGGGETKLLEMTGAFASFGNKGRSHKPTGILEVKDARGKILYKWRETGGTEAVTEETAFLISDILSDDGARSAVFGLNSLLNIPGHRVAVKTGTTDDKRDNYAMGFTPSITTGVWVGNNNNDKLSPNVASGLTGATPIWRKFMIAALKDKKAEPFTPPKTVKKITVDTLTGMLPFDDKDTRQEWFAEGTEPSAPSTWYKKIEVCKEDNKITNEACKKADKAKVKTFVKITAEIPEWQDDVDKWVGENYNNDETYFPPTTKSALQFDDDGDVVSDVDPEITIIDLDEGQTVALQFRLGIEVSSPNEIDEVRFYLDDNHVADDSSQPYGYNFTFTEAQRGEHKFEVVVEDEDGRKSEKSIRLRVD